MSAQTLWERYTVAAPEGPHDQLRLLLRISPTGRMVGLTTTATSGPYNWRVTKRRLGWALTVAGWLAMVAAPVIGASVGHPWEAARSVPQVTAYLILGTIAYTQRPENRAARRLLWFGFLQALFNLAGVAYSAYLVSLGTPSWAWIAVLLLQTLDFTLSVVEFSLIAVFPDGRYRRPNERRLVVGAAVAAPGLATMLILGSPVVTATAFVWQDQVRAVNPLALPGLAWMGVLGSVVIQAGVVLLLIGVGLLIARYRGAERQQRRQIAWPLYAFAVTAILIVIYGALSPALNALPAWLQYVLFLPVVALIPIGLGVGIVRHRLLDIDLVIRRSAVYGVLWILITAAYIAVTAAFGVVIGQRVPLGLAIVLTIVATMAVTPLRHRLERIADRVAFGRRLSGYQLISQLGTQLEASPVPERVADLVADDVCAGLGAQWCRVILDKPEPHEIAVHGSERRTTDTVGLQVPLVHGGEVVGSIECGPKKEGNYTAADHDLLATLGRQAALAIRNSQLTDELTQRLAELAASRERLVHAEAAGRRRLERDIHDGVQQELVAVLARLGLARNQMRRDTGLAEGTLREVQADGRRALESLQELVRGIHPPILTDRGLLDAVRDRVARLPITTDVEVEGLASDARFSPDIESAAYYFVSEAIGNVLKHANASHAFVHLQSGADRLSVQVRDNGRGFTKDTVRFFGLNGLSDRIETLGGRLEIDSASGRGTTVSAWLPTGEHVHA